MSDMSAATVHRDLSVTHGDDSGLFVEFYRNPANDKDYLHIAIPGDKTTDIRRQARDDDKIRFSGQWDAYERGIDQAGDGTLLENWPPLDEGRRLELRAMNIFTVEQLAELSDGVLERVGMGARALRDKARQFADQAKAPALAADLRKQNEALEARISELAAQVEQLKPKRGRPKGS